ncbi:hypothetical protein C5E02_07225 [Rathayibacter rathayi]|uniref:Uncharacterized protein n=1 Tax=Rathayibacter rathayi TaxID=33887 RepID=A0ABD6WBG4_RATRA|nr:hypothetical protein [Rathayibacter rathayi]AZZ49053.1 hypothetical protein C1O28_07465 [Rathayibacter rathayi]MWV76001.1 hypothetical protein [Rathayibacter rathayi NCPPB 2980 = VKM Ac-1601]PPF15186.1 hypothetical protein C5C04_04690 [Rathayibacter rathayi]PPF51127.1 hypothetical protein C5C08_03325 [Rathayibacter rathayi]PPF82867.1 hypothetical protein C5C14_03005 [Rathayibacter rathayi]
MTDNTVPSPLSGSIPNVVTHATFAGSTGLARTVSSGSLYSSIRVKASITTGTWTIVAGERYVLSGSHQSITNSGQIRFATGSIVKLEQDAELGGNLHFLGTSASRVILTSWRDDSIGGEWANESLAPGCSGWTGPRPATRSSSRQYANIRYCKHPLPHANGRRGLQLNDRPAPVPSVGVGGGIRVRRRSHSRAGRTTARTDSEKRA